MRVPQPKKHKNPTFVLGERDSRARLHIAPKGYHDSQTEQMQTVLDQLAEPSVRERIFSIADTLIGGQTVAVSSGRGGGNADSDLRWDGRRPDEEEEAYRRRCL